MCVPLPLRATGALRRDVGLLQVFWCRSAVSHLHRCSILCLCDITPSCGRVLWVHV